MHPAVVLREVADLKALGGLTQLRALSFEGNFAHGVTDVGLKEIAKLTALQALILDRCRERLGARFRGDRIAVRTDSRRRRR